VTSGFDGKGGTVLKRAHNLRIPCNSLCLLFYRDARYQGMIENVSLTGVLVRLHADESPGIRPGEECGLMLCSDPGDCPIRYTCKVVRVDGCCVGMEFVELGSAWREQWK